MWNVHYSSNDASAEDCACVNRLDEVVVSREGRVGWLEGVYDSKRIKVGCSLVLLLIADMPLVQKFLVNILGILYRQGAFMGMFFD